MCLRPLFLVYDYPCSSSDVDIFTWLKVEMCDWLRPGNSFPSRNSSRGVKSGGRSGCRGHSISGKEDGLDSLSFMAWAKAALMTFSEDMLIRRSQSQSLCSYAFTLSRPSKKDVHN
uniref:Uncharacterized protein n=1 Tax=Helianthus annuus TaxID=4232 RepID=A0A5P8T015_HELAN|nr:hypothetical protein [Helianthus annuus]